MDNHCCICGEYLADTSRMICPKCENPAPKELTVKQAIEILRQPEKYMFIHEGEIELEGWLKEAINVGIKSLQRGT